MIDVARAETDAEPYMNNIYIYICLYTYYIYIYVCTYVFVFTNTLQELQPANE